MNRTLLCSIAVALACTRPLLAVDAPSSTAIEFHPVLRDEAPILSLAMQAGEQDDSASHAVPAVDVAPVFGAQDTWRLNFMLAGGFGLDPDRDTIMGLGGVGFSYFLVDNFSIELELNAMGFDQDGPDAFGGNFNFLFRWHIVPRETWSFFVDLGAGVLVTNEDVPRDTQSFNFTPQGGIGVSFEVAPDTRAILGVRLHHTSNANTSDNNIGLDCLMAYAGISLPF